MRAFHTSSRLCNVAAASAESKAMLKTYSISASNKVNARTDIVTKEGINLAINDKDLPNPLETTLAALVACEVATARYLASKVLKMQVGTINFKTIEGTLDMRGFFKGEVPAHFQTVKMFVEIETNEPQEKVDLLHKLVKKQCPVYSMFVSCGTQMDDTWVKL
jgi:uncharacterized OsmC-like protein